MAADLENQNKAQAGEENSDTKDASTRDTVIVIMAADLENQNKAQAGEENSDTKDASPSKAGTESPEDKKAKALMSLVTGKRNMLVRDIPAAVSSLGEACELLSAECGETSPECA